MASGSSVVVSRVAFVDSSFLVISHVSHDLIVESAYIED